MSNRRQLISVSGGASHCLIRCSTIKGGKRAVLAQRRSEREVRSAHPYCKEIAHTHTATPPFFNFDRLLRDADVASCWWVVDWLRATTGHAYPATIITCKARDQCRIIVMGFMTGGALSRRLRLSSSMHQGVVMTRPGVLCGIFFAYAYTLLMHHHLVPCKRASSPHQKILHLPTPLPEYHRQPGPPNDMVFMPTMPAISLGK